HRPGRVADGLRLGQKVEPRPRIERRLTVGPAAEERGARLPQRSLELAHEGERVGGQDLPEASFDRGVHLDALGLCNHRVLRTIPDAGGDPSGVGTRRAPATRTLSSMLAYATTIAQAKLRAEFGHHGVVVAEGRPARAAHHPAGDEPRTPGSRHEDAVTVV